MKKIVNENMGSDFIGKKVNFYEDPENRINSGSAKILSITPKNFNGLNGYLIMVSGQEIGNPKVGKGKLMFHCMGMVNRLSKIPQKMFLMLNDANREIGAIYNDNLYDALVKKFCSVSRGGTTVPKADFATSDVESPESMTDQSMTEGKRVVRLTESDLVRLVKKVINEKSSLD
jgi:hypothetical protein